MQAITLVLNVIIYRRVGQKLGADLTLSTSSQTAHACSLMVLSRQQRYHQYAQDHDVDHA